MKFNTENTMGNKNPFFGKKHSEESKRKIGEASKGRKAFLGRHHSEKTKTRIGLANKGKKHIISKESKKQLLDAARKSSEIRRGKPLSIEHKKKLSEAHIRNGDHPPHEFGEKNPNWKGGISYKIAVRFTLEKYDYTCQICGLRDPDVIEVDHRLCKALRPDLYQDLNNLWTLCANCHKRKTKLDWIEIRKSRAK